MILDKMGEYLKSGGYGEITSEDLRNLAQAYSLLKQDESEEAFTPSSRINYYS